MPEENQNPQEIAQDALDRWNSLPAEEPLLVQLTRRDLDDLFLSLRSALIAQDALSSVVYLLSNGKAADADAEYLRHSANFTDSANRLNRFISTVMRTASPTDVSST